MLVIQGALLFQFQVVLEEMVKVPLPPVAGMLRVAWLRVRVTSTPAWVTVWVRVRLPAVMVMVPVRLAVEGLRPTE